MATNLAVSPGVCCFFFVFGKWLVPSFAFLEKIVPSSASSYLFSKVKTFWCININSECDYTFVLLFPCIHFFSIWELFFFFSHVITHLYPIMCIINWLLSSSSFSWHKTFSKNWQHLKPIWTFTYSLLKSHECVLCNACYYNMGLSFFFSWNEIIIFITNRSANIICEQLRKWVCQLHHHIYHWHPTIGHF